MLEFKKITIDDYKILKQYLTNENEFSCENSFANLLLWHGDRLNEYAISHGSLIIKTQDGENVLFRLPIGGDFNAAMKDIYEYCSDDFPNFYSSEGETFNKFLSSFSNDFEIYDCREDYEYIYSTEDLINLSGKKYHSKRNHISAFSKKYDWHYETINEQNKNKIIECARQWYKENSHKKDASLVIDKDESMTLLSNIDNLELKGGAIFIGEKAVAYTIGSAINKDVFDIMIEKALPEYATAYAVINREFAKNELSDYKYINREDDMGIEGLRRAKLSYKPCKLIKKYYCCRSNINEEIKEIYDEAFGCDDEFTKKLLNISGSCCRVLKSAGISVSMLFLLPVSINSQNDCKKAYYLFAAATRNNYRKRGFMEKLIKSVIADIDAPIILKPANDDLIDYYKKFGFKEFKAQYSGDESFSIKPIDEFLLLDETPDEKTGEYTAMYYSKEELNLNNINFSYTME